MAWYLVSVHQLKQPASTYVVAAHNTTDVLIARACLKRRHVVLSQVLSRDLCIVAVADIAYIFGLACRLRLEGFADRFQEDAVSP